MDIQPYLKLLVEKNASDLFFTADSPVKLKVEGRVTSVGKTLLTPELVDDAERVMLVAVTEKRTDAELDAYIAAFGDVLEAGGAA